MKHLMHCRNCRACVAACCLLSLSPNPFFIWPPLTWHAVWAVVSMQALYSPCTRRMGLHQRHIEMTGTMNSLALNSLTQYIGLRPILFQCTKSITFTVLVKCTNFLSCNRSSYCSSTSVCVCVGGGRRHYLLGNSCSCTSKRKAQFM